MNFANVPKGHVCGDTWISDLWLISESLGGLSALVVQNQEALLSPPGRAEADKSYTRLTVKNLLGQGNI